MREFDSYAKGSYGETIAEGYLEGKGYTILKKRYRCPYGEIDIIARYGELIVFVEVKLRRTLKSGYGAESVTPAKQRRIIQTALWYTGENDITEESFRFDIIEVYGREFYGVTHIENAFYYE